MTAPSEGTVLPRDLLLNGIMVRALVPTNMENIPIPLGGNYTSSRPFILEQGVSCDGGPVIDLMNIGWLDPVAFTKVRDAGDNANRRICRRGAL
jgi:hypothetical protein